MKLLIVSCLVAFACGDVSHILPKRTGTDEKNAQIVKQELDVSPDGSYQWSIETDNGIAAGATGDINKIDADTSIQSVQGRSSYISPEGEKIDLTYIANENGFQPQGAHLPTPPPIPDAIVRALQYILEHPQPVQKP